MVEATEERRNSEYEGDPTLIQPGFDGAQTACSDNSVLDDGREAKKSNVLTGPHQTAILRYEYSFPKYKVHEILC